MRTTASGTRDHAPIAPTEIERRHRGITCETFGEYMNTARRFERMGNLPAAAEAARNAHRIAAGRPAMVQDGRALPPALRADLERLMALDSPLTPGDRVRSAHAGRTGRVVKAYADGSACVHWDDREPQAEGLGHERMPSHLLVKVQASTPADLASASRAFAGLIESGKSTLAGPEDTITVVDRFLAAVAAQPAPVPSDLSAAPVDISFAHDVLHRIVERHADRLPAGLVLQAVEALERLESAPFAWGGAA